jgi:pimeloyl-ACP methyl ester carboxylesterase
MPWRNEDMRARIQAALEKQIQQNTNKPKSPQEAAQPPTDRPTTEIVSGAPTLPEKLPHVPKMPRVDYVQGAVSGEVQAPNPIKEHLGSEDRIELLEKHVDAGADRDKLKVEVEKADPKVLLVNLASMAGVDTLRELLALRMPVLTVYGANDTFLPPPSSEILADLRNGNGPFHAISMDGTRHFPMLENIAGFTRLMLDFLETQDITKLEIKKTWERRVR